MVCIMVSLLHLVRDMADNYRSWKKKLNISGKETWYYVFTVVRTFILVLIGNYFDRADSVGQAFLMMKQSRQVFAPSQLLMIPAGKQGTAFTPYALFDHWCFMCDSVYCQCT